MYKSQNLATSVPTTSPAQSLDFVHCPITICNLLTNHQSQIAQRRVHQAYKFSRLAGTDTSAAYKNL